jgi:PAS domain S-box-containing protein
MADQQTARSPSGVKPTSNPLVQDEIILRQAITHSTPSATYIARFDATSSNLFVSPEIDRFLDLKPNETVADPNFWYNHLHPEDRDFVMAEITRQHQSERPIHLRYRMITGSGEIRTIRDDAFIIRDAQGQPLFLQGTLHDITTLLETESALTETFDRLHFLENIIEKSPTLVFRWRRDDAETVEFVTENISQLGYPALDLLDGRIRWTALIHPPDLPRRTRELQAYLHSGTDEFILQYRLVSRLGDLRWFEDRSRVIRDPQGHPTHIEGLLFDITQRKITEQNRAFQNAFRSVVAALRSTPAEADETVIWQTFLQALIDAFGFALVWYGPVQNGSLTPRYWAGPGAAYLQGLSVNLHGTPTLPPDCPILAVLRTIRPHTHSPSAVFACPFQAGARDNGLQSTLALPHLNATQLLEGVLVLYSGESQAFASDTFDGFQDLVLEIREILQDRCQKREAAITLRESEEQYRQLSRRLQTIREEESTRISRVIHDDLGQSLSVLKMDTVRLSRRMETAPPDLQSITTAMLEMIDRALFTTQRIAMDLHPGILDDLGLAPALEWYVQQMQPHTEVSLSQTTEPPDLIVPPAIALSLFRILQEAVTNTLRHAGATTLSIHLSGDAAGFRLLIEDDGTGIPPDQLTSPTAFGLIQIHERARALNGQVQIKSHPGGGTRIEVRIPSPPP